MIARRRSSRSRNLEAAKLAKMYAKGKTPFVGPLLRVGESGQHRTRRRCHPLAAHDTQDYDHGRNAAVRRPYLLVTIPRICRAFAGVQEKWSCADGPSQSSSASNRKVAMASMLRTRRTRTRCPPLPLLLPDSCPRSTFLVSQEFCLCRGQQSTPAGLELSCGLRLQEVWPELMALAPSGLTWAEVEPGNGQRHARHDHSVSMGGGRCSML